MEKPLERKRRIAVFFEIVGFKRLYGERFELKTMAGRFMLEKKEKIIRDLKGEIQEMQIREKEYHTCMDQLQALESQIESMKDEKANLEARKRKLQAESEAESTALKEQLRVAKHTAEEKQKTFDKVSKEKYKLEEMCLEKKKELSRVTRDVEALLDRNSTLESKIQAYRRQTLKKDEENKEMNSRVEELMQQLEKLTEHNRQLEREVFTLDSDISSLKDQVNTMEDEKERQQMEYERKKQRHMDNGKSIQAMEEELFVVEKEIKQLRSINDNYKAEMVTCEKTYQSQMKKNNEIKSEYEKLEAAKR